ncbi:hypothetical protein K503DRAFT_362342 [Rhizopogon vinicolor AM-OR11-026]|uniref:Uncharacterized protein n=1 Tax=Rhizopogon vinicolor AM-OR11-026 TaxID=1314800 RepID=A0A1B7NBX8_9AGAM|nr:hypothetical protein K503DRAFT_362342 [Rhizopogon vinicolor AM-OR11-026]
MTGSSESCQGTIRNVEQENTNARDSSARSIPQMPTTSTAGGYPPSLFSTGESIPVTPLYTLPGPNTSNIVEEITPENSSDRPSSDPNIMASPTGSHFESIPVTPVARDTCDIATISTSTCNTSPTTESRASLTLMMDAPKVPDANPWASAGSNWLTDLGGNTDTDRVFRDTLSGAFPSLSTQSSQVSNLNSGLTSPASSFPHALLPSMSISLISIPVSSPFASSSLHCTSLAFTATPVRLTLLSTDTVAFPSSIDNAFERWREDVAVQMDGWEIVSQIPFVDHTGSSADHTERTGVSLPLPGSSQEETNPHATSKLFLQKVKKIGGCVRRFVTRGKRRKPHGAMEPDARVEVHSRPGSNSGSIVMISALPPSCDTRPSRPIPHTPEHLRRTMSMFSPHSLLVRGRACENFEGAIEVSLPLPPADTRERPLS